MIATFALVLSMYNGGMVVIPHYPDKAACEAAGEIATDGMRSRWWSVVYACVPEPLADNILQDKNIFGGGDAH